MLAQGLWLTSPETALTVHFTVLPRGTGEGVRWTFSTFFATLRMLTDEAR
jgi:hypothetical protein